jgi:molybdopterin-containing oxidoreductase family membrane subunit
VYGLKNVITGEHLQNLAKFLLATSLIVSYSYLMEGFFEWSSGSQEGWYAAIIELRGHHVGMHWAVLICNSLLPLALAFSAVRRNTLALLAISIAVLAGMWLERYLIIIPALERDFLPSAWGPYRPTIWDWALTAGMFGLFLSLFLLFLRVLPIVSMFEVRRDMADEQASSAEATEAAP